MGMTDFDMELRDAKSPSSRTAQRNFPMRKSADNARERSVNSQAIQLPSRSTTADKIQAIVADSYGISRLHMTSASRCPQHAHPRQLAMYLTRKLRNATLTQIGRRYHRDHTTVLYAIRAVEKRLRTNPALRADVRVLLEALRG